MRKEVTAASGILPNIIMLKPICPWERNTWAGVPQLASSLIRRFGAESLAGRCDHLRIVKRLRGKALDKSTHSLLISLLKVLINLFITARVMTNDVRVD